MNHFPWIIDPNQLFLKTSHFRKRRGAAVQAQGRIDVVNEYLKQKAEEKAAAEAEEQAAYESQKQAHKDNADAVIYGTSGEDFIIQGESTNPSTGQPINFFVDAKGVDYPSVWPDGGPPYDRDWVETADGDDVIYAPGFSIVFSKGGDDIIYMEDGYLPNENEEKLHYFSKAFAGDGSDQIFAEDGSTHAFGGDGDDLIDLGPDADGKAVDLVRHGLSRRSECCDSVSEFRQRRGFKQQRGVGGGVGGFEPCDGLEITRVSHDCGHGAQFFQLVHITSWASRTVLSPSVEIATGLQRNVKPSKLMLDGKEIKSSASRPSPDVIPLMLPDSERL